MANYLGGSAPAMAAQIHDGFILMSASTLRGYSIPDLQVLRLELEKLLRTARSEVPPADDALAQAARNRRIARLSSALQVVGAQITTRK
jgi:hypothetical protein